MRNLLLRRATILVAILALLAGVQMRAMPMAMALPDSHMAGMASDLGAGTCKACMPGKMAITDCSVLCAAIVAVIAGVQPTAPIDAPSPWAWSNELLRAHGVGPDDAPPRS